MTIAALCRRLIECYGGTELAEIPGVARATIRDFYFPLLVDYTHEDAAAKGLRKFKEERAEAEPPIYFSALEQVCAEPRLLLLGERGSGKTCIALHLALNLAGEAIGSADFNLAKLCRSAPRNEHGALLDERWSGDALAPLYLPVEGPDTLDGLIARHAPEAAELLGRDAGHRLLVIIDGVDRLGSSGPEFLDAAIQRFANARLLATGELGVCRNWTAPSAVRTLRLLPLLAAQRAAYRQELARRGMVVAASSDSAASANPGLFMLSLGLSVAPTSAHDLVDRWLAATGLDPDRIVPASFAAYAGHAQVDTAFPKALRARFAQAFLAARHLDGQPARAAELFHRDPDRWTGPVEILAARLQARGRSVEALVDALAAAEGDAGLLGALVAAGFMPAPPAATKESLLRIVEGGRLSTRQRADAGRHLARLGDPRDLEELVDAPGGRFVMGSALHPNSSPPHQVEIGPYRIGRYPVTNRLYGRFIAANGRHWRSSDGRLPERSNAPAVDLTWHDARAFCAWLTVEWRSLGRIGPHEIVRLPTEPEWEHAARGAQADRGEAIYPWQGAWRPDHENSEEAGFNDTCAVGLFPNGRSAFGCDDMCGQVWEWCSTLWGADMATPAWIYPYADDGREDADGAPDIRRVLRGGCFSSNKEKACCTYRGSLEPNGFWRGNGFRIVVARS